MLFIALKNLLQERTKLFMSIGGVAFAVVLIILLNGLYEGWNESMGAYPKSIPADLWVEQDGVGDMFHALSFLPNNLSDQLKQIDGVNTVHPYLGRQTLLKLNGEDTSLFIVAVDPATGFGKPKTMEDGRWEDLKDGEIIIDEVFAKKQHLNIGDEIQIAERKLKIGGISSGGNMMVFQYAFVTLNEAKELFQLGDKVNFYVIQVAPQADQEKIKNTIINDIPGVKVLTKQEFVDTSRQVIKDSFLPIIYVLVIIGFIIGSAVIGVTIYSATVEKSREYGVLKAIGVTHRQLYAIVMFQSLVSGIIGYVVGLILAYPVARLSRYFVAGFMTEFRLIDIVWVFGATIGMALIATYIPVRRLASIDPAEVFKN
ncbi:MAG: ABC transporter permease [Candidatus Kerfeldbacteria bacterium]|nr:ABC transporter permease [Candidatus Kerfeldbacteria bacterium]